jgi:hypothetical protein
LIVGEEVGDNCRGNYKIRNSLGDAKELGGIGIKQQPVPDGVPYPVPPTINQAYGVKEVLLNKRYLLLVAGL